MKTEPASANEIFDRLLSGTGLQRDAQLAALLEVTPQAVSQARRKQKIPEGWLVRIAVQFGLSMDWLLFGAMPAVQYLAETSARHEEPGAVSTMLKKTSEPDRVPPTGIVEKEKAPLIHHTPTQPLAAGDEAPEIDLLCVPLVAASLSAGVGSLETENEILDFFAFRSEWLCRKGNPDKMVLMKVYGDSMEPQICHGDMALIDQSKQQIYAHTIYAVGVNEEIYIKQIETLPGHRMVLRSLNERYDPIEIDLRGDMAESVRVIGKVIWWCREA